MQIQVTTRHGHINTSTQERIIAKVEKLPRFFDRLGAIEVIVDLKDANQPRVDIKASAGHKQDFIGHDQSSTLLSAVESAIHKVEEQLRRYKQRLKSPHRDSTVRRPQDLADQTDDEE